MLADASRKRACATSLFAIVALLPVFRRLGYPTVVGDDLTRIVDLIERPLGGLLFRPFSEHVAPLFESVSWLTWQAVGHDLRLAPLGFSAASILPWVLLLIGFGWWLRRETGSRTASLAAVALVAQSPLVLETMWWYSASSFTWAILCVLVAVIGAGLLGGQPRVGSALIGAGSALAPAFSTIGILAIPLVVVRALFEPSVSWRRKAAGIAVGVAALTVYLLVCRVAGMGLLHSIRTNKRGSLEPLMGLRYALSVPGRVLWPSVVGVRASWTVGAWPEWLAIALGSFALIVAVAMLLRPRARWNRRLILAGAAMIYMSYTLTYSSRFAMVRQGHWTEAQLLYDYAERYHVLPLLGAVAILAAVLAAIPSIRACDRSPCRPALFGIAVGLAALIVHRREEDRWRWIIRQPDQKATLAALHRLGEVARAEGITRAQLARIIDPALRSWNGSLRVDQPAAFPMVKLVVRAPEAVAVPLPDDEARARVLRRLGPIDRRVLAAGTCASLLPGRPGAHAEVVSTARGVGSHHAQEVHPGQYRMGLWPNYVEYEVQLTEESRFLVIPGLSADQDVRISWDDQAGRWRPLDHVFWTGVPVPPPDLPAAIDLKRLINGPEAGTRRIRLQLYGPGELAVGGSPYLLR